MRYSKQLTTANKKLESMLRLSGQIQRIVNKLADDPTLETLARSVRRLRRELREVSRGVAVTEAVYDHSFNVLTVDEGSDLVKAGMREMYRGLYRKLCQIYHPDKASGNVDQFDMIRKSWVVGDYAYLQHVWNTRHEATNLWWRVNHGTAYCKKVEENAHQRFELLRNTVEFSIVQAHLQGNAELALKQTAIVLTRLVATLQQEIEVARNAAKNAL